MTRRGAVTAALQILALVWVGQAVLLADRLLRAVAGPGMRALIVTKAPAVIVSPGDPAALSGGMMLLLAAAALAVAMPARIAARLDPGHPGPDQAAHGPVRLAAVLVGLVFITLGLGPWAEALARMLPMVWQASGPGPRTLTDLVRPIDVSGWVALLAPLLPVLYGALLIAARRRVAELAAVRAAREHAP